MANEYRLSYTAPEIDEKLQKVDDLLKISEYELLKLLAEVDAVQPLANNDGAIYTSNSGKVYIL